MAEYLSPGVYIEEIDAGPKPIEGVSTSTAGAVGVTARGPTSGKPELVTSFADFVRKFGGFLQLPPQTEQTRWASNAVEGSRWWHFPLAVKGFFDNGGQRLYVKRVFSRDAKKSDATFMRGLVAEIERDASHDPANPQQPAVLTLSHLLGIQNQSQVTIRNGETGQQIGGFFTVNRYDSQTRQVSFSGPLPPNTDIRASRSDKVVIRDPQLPAASGLIVRAKASGKWGNALRVRVRPMVGATLTLLHDPVNGGADTRAVVRTLTPPAAGAPANAPWTVAVTPAPVGASAALTGFNDNDRILIEGREYTISNVLPNNNTFDISGLQANTNWPVGTAIQRLRTARLAQLDQLRIWGANQLYLNAVVELDNGTQKEEASVKEFKGDLVTFAAPLQYSYHEGHRTRVVELEITAQYSPDGRVEAEETFSNLRLVAPTTDLNYAVTRINAESALIELNDSGAAQPTAINQLPAAADRWLNLINGDDALPTLDVDAFVGVDGGSGNRTGIQALEDIDEISICLAPGIWSRSVHNALIQHCEALKDRFAILDPKDNLSIEGIRSFREVYDTKYAALYYPWIEVRDPLAKRNVEVAPSGHIAGIYARVDVARGVHKAPANEVINGITKIAQDVTKREQDLLNPKNINVLRFFPNRGNRVWGARVVTSDSAWKYISVRRLFIYVEESIDESTQWVVFEPNDEPLWARVRASIANFLTTVWRTGALQGTKPDEAFFVKCDRTTMTQDDIDNGRLICVIGIAPVKPAEFVIFRIQQKTIENRVGQ